MPPVDCALAEHDHDLPAVTHVPQRSQAVSAHLEPQRECLVPGDLRFGDVIVADHDRPRISCGAGLGLSTSRSSPRPDLAWIGARMQARVRVFEFSLDTSSVPGFAAFNDFVAHPVLRHRRVVRSIFAPLITFQLQMNGCAIKGAGIQARLRCGSTRRSQMRRERTLRPPSRRAPRRLRRRPRCPRTARPGVTARDQEVVERRALELLPKTNSSG